jgi:hypothetical protein
MVIILIKNSLVKDPDTRPDIGELSNDEWLRWTMQDGLSVQNWLQEKFSL